jgi:hypothetical protein
VYAIDIVMSTGEGKVRGFFWNLEFNVWV